MDSRMDTYEYYGPIDRSLLIFQDSHCCNDVLSNSDGALDTPLTVRGLEIVVWGKLSRPVRLHGRILEKLDTMSFYDVYSCGSQKLDPHLITALVERWRKETHTFHLPVGEATVTLENVGKLWGLPVDGHSVSGVIHSRTQDQWIDYLEELTGYRPAVGAYSGTKVSLRKVADWLEANEIDDDSEDYEVDQRARAYALLLMGSVLFPDSSGSSTSMTFLPLLEDIDAVHTYSWGSAVLAFLYRELCTSCQCQKMNIGGALRLLHVWAWMRILPVQPVITRPRVQMKPTVEDGIQLPMPPHAASNCSNHQKMSMRFTMASSTSALPKPPPTAGGAPRLPIPGTHGWPLVGPLIDRLQYFWFQGPSNFFKKRIEKYNSTVFKTNVPPTFPLFAGVNPNVIALVDVKSFSHLFDMELVDKSNVLVGDFMPSVKYTGGLRVCAYLDTSEDKHAQIKNFALDILKRSSKTWTSSMISTLDTMWDSIDGQISAAATGGTASLFMPLQQFLFSFLSKTLLGADPSKVPEMAESGHIMIDKWLAFQLLPTISINVLQPLEEIFLHSFSFPFWLIKSDYDKLSSFIKNEAKEAMDRAQKEFNLTEEEAIHNLLFIFGFNAFGGFSLFMISLFKNLGSQGKTVHEHLRAEVRQKIAEKNGVLGFEAVKEMDLINSFVYETLRLNPPVPSQFGRARKDFDLSSHEAVFEIKKGQLLCGYQPLVMRDPKVFENPEEFLYSRFSKEKGGDELLKYLFWSNGPQIGENPPSSSNKQCAARDFVPMAAAFVLAYLFQRYDEIGISSTSVTALQKAAK